MTKYEYIGLLIKPTLDVSKTAIFPPGPASGIASRSEFTWLNSNEKIVNKSIKQSFGDVLIPIYQTQDEITKSRMSSGLTGCV